MFTNKLKCFQNLVCMGHSCSIIGRLAGHIGPIQIQRTPICSALAFAHPILTFQVVGYTFDPVFFYLVSTLLYNQPRYSQLMEVNFSQRQQILFRIEYLLSDANPVCVVTNKNDDNDVYAVDTKVFRFDVLREKSFNFSAEDLPNDERLKQKCENIFAVMYTSGTKKMLKTATKVRTS